MNAVAFRRSLLLGCALGASLAASEAANAQAVNATPNTVSGSVVYSRDTVSSPGSETVVVETQSAIIDWTPPRVLPPGPYVFLPDGNVLTFINGFDNDDFVVLNRILTLQPSRFDGTVISRLRGTSDVPDRPGGTVLFSSPGGIIVGPNALFDVGNLVLTTLNVVVDDNGGFVTPQGGFQFNAGEDFPNAAVITEAGAQFVATSENSYIAMVAPRVEHAGSVDVNGSAAYIAGEQLEFSVNQGLFDIDIAVGSDNAQPIIHTGATGGPASTGGTDNHGIYFAAVPKNQAITMLLQGSVGFDPATDVSVENGVIVLSAGYDVTGGAIEPTPQGGFAANIELSDAAFTSDTVGAASGDITATATVGDPMTFAGSLDVDAAGRIDFVAADGASVTIGEDLTLAAAILDLDDVAAGGDITLDATGDIVVGTADAGDDFTATAGGAFTGGTVTAQVGSDIVISSSGDLTLDNAAASGLIELTSQAGSVLSAGLLDAGTYVRVSAGANIDLTDVDAGTFIDLLAPNGTIDARNLTAGDSIFAFAGGDLAIETGDSGSSIFVNAAGDADLGTLAAVDSIFISADDLLVASAIAGRDVDLTGQGDVGVGFAQAGDDFTANAGGAFNGGTVLVTGLGFDNDAISEIPGNPSPLRGANIVVTANGGVRLDNGDAPDAIRLTSDTASILSDGTLRSTSLTANAALNLDLNDVFVVDELTLTAANGFIDGNSFNSDGAIDLEASGDVTLASANAGDDIVIDAGGNLRLDNGTTPGAIDLISGGSIFSDGTLQADRLDAVAAADLLFGNVFVVDDLFLVTDGGEIRGNSLNSDGDITLEASGAITVANADSGGTIDFTGGGDVTLDRGTAAEAILLTSTQGSILSGLDGGGGGDSLEAAGTSGLLTAGTDIIADAAIDIRITDADAGDVIVFDAGRDVEVRNLTAGDSVDIEAVGFAGFEGVVDSPTISIVSSDIEIAVGGRLGTAATELVELTVRPNGAQTVLGGSTEGPGYTLTDAEADRIRAAELLINAPANGTAANRAPDLLVRDLSLSATRTGTVEIVTPGIAQVEGEFVLADAAAANGIDFTATERLQVVTPTGAVRVRDASGLTAGFLDLNSNNIWAASAGILQQLLADPDFEGRDAALTVNTGPFNPRGYIEAGDVTLFARDTLFVQNSGSIVDFAGITVRENTLTIVPTGPQPLAVFAFGRRINPDGSFVTNNIFFREVAFQQGASGYKNDAQFNLCFINAGVCRLPTPDDPVPGGPDIVEEPVGGPNVALLPDEELVDTSFADDPLIEQPVTSGSDSELWDCDRDDDGDCDEDDRDE